MKAINFPEESKDIAQIRKMKYEELHTRFLEPELEKLPAK